MVFLLVDVKEGEPEVGSEVTGAP